MKVAVFSLAYSPFVGGAEIAVKEIMERLPDFDFQIFAHDFQKYGHGRPAKFFYIFRSWLAAERAHKKEPFKAIWGVMAAYAGFAALLFKLRHPKIPFLLTLQEGDSEGHILNRVGILYPFWRLIFKRADRIQAISNYLADFAKRYGAICPIEVVPNGVSLENFQFTIFNFQKKSQNPNAKIIITTSRLVHKNGLDTLICAIPELHKLKIKNCKLKILGSGPDELKLKQLVRDLRVENYIEFLGHIDPEKIPEYLAKADIFVRPSRSEGLGSSFLEAMAAGLPVIGTAVGGIPDFLKNPSVSSGQVATGLLAKVDDPKDLAEKMKILLTDSKLYARLSENGRKLVLENYSWDLISSKMESIFQKLKIKRLLIATGIYPPDIGGPATYTELLEEELPKRSFKVDHLAFTEFRKKPKIIRHLAYFWSCLWKSKNFEIVYAQDPVSVGLPSLLAARILGKKFFIRVAGDYAWEQAVQRFGVKDGIDDFQKRRYGWRTELLRNIQKWVVGRADLVITPSKYFQKLVGGWIKNPKKVKVIYNGIQLQNPNAKIQMQNNPPAGGPNSKTILSAGRLVPWKGFDVLIDIMKDLPDWRLIIVGDGPEYDNLKFKIACLPVGKENLKLNNQVSLAGSIPREKLLDHLRKASVFVLNTSFESFSFQVVEAMNASVPVVTTNIGNLTEIIEDGKEGILVEPNNKEQILTAIERISRDEDFREMIVKNAKEKAQQFSISRTVDNLVNLIHDASK